MSSERFVRSLRRAVARPAHRGASTWQDWGFDFLEKEAFVCADCRKSNEAVAISSRHLLELQSRRAKDLPRCARAAAIEGHMAVALQNSGTQAADVVVRIVSNQARDCPRCGRDTRAGYTPGRRARDI